MRGTGTRSLGAPTFLLVTGAAITVAPAGFAGGSSTPTGTAAPSCRPPAPGENTGDGVVIAFPTATTGVTTDASWLNGGGSFGASGTDALFGTAIDE
ncbi:hypothetical protein [Streptomyces sp. NPDC060002]|uniref:hypothetical protein n=1 Tax=Streptomyces sp. NPDC060002 TaxID=3347033 RepID=UPI003685B10B